MLPARLHIASRQDDGSSSTATTTMSSSTVSTRQAAARLRRVADRMRGKYRDMNMLQYEALLFIAENPGTTQRDLYKALGSNDSVSSRTLGILSDRGLRNKKGEIGGGLGLVDMRSNPHDFRSRLLYLSREGERLMRDCAKDLDQPTKGG